MINVHELTVRYGNHTAVDAVSFTCHPGRITGFLGPNGSGKSTTMRAIVGLVEPTEGHTTIGGVPYTQLGNPGLVVGTALDASAQHPNRTGAMVLGLTAHTLGVPTDRVAPVLNAVGLTAAEGKQRVGKYSLGMRQRLALGVALIGNPDVLILDEPANGLDPSGIRWMRDFLRSFTECGGTVLLSSHLLSEVEVLADDLVVLSSGRVIAAGTAQEINANGDLESLFLDLTASTARDAQLPTFN